MAIPSKLRLEFVTPERAIVHEEVDELQLPGEGGFHPALVAAYRPFDTQAEAYRGIRSQILLHWVQHERHPLAIVSAGRAEGRSVLAANLAISFAQLGRRTLLIDADLRHGVQHQLFNLPDSMGLGPLLAEFDLTARPMQNEQIADLFLLPAGYILPNPQELITRAQFGVLLREANDHFDVVIVDTPASSEAADAVMIAAQCGSAVMIGARFRSETKLLNKLARSLRRNCVDIVGAVLN